MTERIYYSTIEAEEKTGLSKATINKYEKEFGLSIKKEGNKKSYSEKNIEEILSIKNDIQKLGSYTAVKKKRIYSYTSVFMAVLSTFLIITGIVFFISGLTVYMHEFKDVVFSGFDVKLLFSKDPGFRFHTWKCSHEFVQLKNGYMQAKIKMELYLDSFDGNDFETLLPKGILLYTMSDDFNVESYNCTVVVNTLDKFESEDYEGYYYDDVVESSAPHYVNLNFSKYNIYLTGNEALMYEFPEDFYKRFVYTGQHSYSIDIEYSLMSDEPVKDYSRLSAGALNVFLSGRTQEYLYKGFSNVNGRFTLKGEEIENACAMTDITWKAEAAGTFADIDGTVHQTEGRQLIASYYGEPAEQRFYFLQRRQEWIVYVASILGLSPIVLGSRILHKTVFRT